MPSPESDARTVGVALVYAAATSIGSLLVFLIAAGAGPSASIADVPRLVLALAMIVAVVGVTFRLIDSRQPHGWDAGRVLVLAGILGVVGGGLAAASSAAGDFGLGYALIPFALLPALAFVYASRGRNAAKFTVGLAAALMVAGPLLLAGIAALATVALSATGDRQLAAALDLFGGKDVANVSFAVMRAVWNFIVVLAFAARTWWWLQRIRAPEPRQ